MRKSNWLVAIPLVVAPALAQAAIYQFIFRGPATVSINGGAASSQSIELIGVGDLSNLSHAGTGPGWLVDIVPLASLTVRGGGIGDRSIPIPGEFHQQNVNPAMYLMPRSSMSMGGIGLDGILLISPNTADVREAVSCSDCSSELTDRLGNRINFEFASGAVLTAIGTPAIPEPATWLLFAAGGAMFGLRRRKT